MALGLWLVALACGRDLGFVAGGLWLVAMVCGSGHGLWPLPWLLAVAMVSSRGPSLWPRPWFVADGWLLDSWTAKLSFVGLWLLDYLFCLWLSE